MLLPLHQFVFPFKDPGISRFVSTCWKLSNIYDNIYDITSNWQSTSKHKLHMCNSL